MYLNSRKTALKWSCLCKGKGAKKAIMINLRKAAIAAVAIVLLGLVFSGSASATGRPAVVRHTGSGCNFATLAPWYNCTTVNGSGLKINYISGYVHNPADGPLSNLHVEIYGPKGLIKNCGTFSVGASDDGPICKWTNPSPGTNEPAGDYCTVTWQYEGGNSYEEGGPECIGVHS